MIIPAMVVPIIAVPSGPPMIPMAAPTVASSSSSVPALRTTAAASSLTVQQRTQQLHESYRRALQQQAEELQQKNGVKPLTTTDAASALSRSPIPQMAPTTPLSSSPPATSVTPTKATIKSTPSPKQTPPPTPKTSAARPDFLSGFEKVVPPAKRGKMSTAALTSSDQPNSLPLRNRLMEDFHRLLEKKDNVTLVNVAVTTTSGNDALTADTDNIVYDTTALFTAESYAMFAQQSAMEASRHGAYAFQLNSFPLVSTKRLPSAKTLDLDDVLQRIADDAIKAPSSSAKASPDHWPNQAQESHSPENKSHVAAETGLGNKKRQMTKSMVATPSSPPPININKNNKTSGLTPVERFVGAATTKHLVSEPSGSSRSAHSHHHNTNSDETTSNSSSSDDTTGATSNDEGQSSSEGEGEAKRTKFDSSSSAQVPRRTRLEYRN